MSLTSFIKMPEMKMLFKQEFPLSSTKLTGEMKAVPITKNYPLVGTAFDYLFRFYLERENSNCMTKPWVAENSLMLLEQALEEYGSKAPLDMIDASNKMKLFLQSAKDIYHEYLNSGNLNDDLIRITILLAQMDVLYRSGRMYPNFGNVEKGDIEDLRNLISLVNAETFRAENACYLNPTFGYGSELVGGADADLIIDDTLIDVKTTKFLSFTQEHYNQLIGYYILAKLGKINEKEDIPISKIGIYFSRHGVLHIISADEIENNPGFPKFVRVFEKLASAVFEKN